MDGVNAVTIIGNVGNITEIHTTSNEKKVVNISIATSETFYDSSNTKKAETQWHNIVLWNSLAEIGSKYIFKGCLLYVEGKLNYRKRNDGNVATEIVAKTIRVLNKKSGMGEQEVIVDTN
jgi:single-strand DNA-binding protein